MIMFQGKKYRCVYGKRATEKGNILLASGGGLSFDEGDFLEVLDPHARPASVHAKVLTGRCAGSDCFILHGGYSELTPIEETVEQV